MGIRSVWIDVDNVGLSRSLRETLSRAAAD
jgi:hypothetical protein